MTSVLPAIDVPYLTGGRDRARALVEQLDGSPAGAVVIVDFRNTVAGTPSFADELVRLVLVDGDALLLRADHVPVELGQYLLDAARDHGVVERFHVM